ncbi:MAG TPA: ankyrin repeat domain-containing protein [Gemmatimonadales bacterium]|nr:ankyrin repeat domain-containing protein [Gemmatimonadales bacterium]
MTFRSLLKHRRLRAIARSFRRGVAIVGASLALAGTANAQVVAEAARRNDLPAVRALLKQGADVNAALGDGMTALHWAAVQGNAELAEVLLYAGANVRAVTRLGDYTALHLASRGGHAAVVSALLRAGADVKAKTSTGGATSLHFAAGAGAVEAARALLDAGAEVDAAESVWAQTPLMWAASANRVDVVRLLLERGARIAATTRVVDLPSLARADRDAARRRDQVLQAFRAQAGPNAPGWRPAPSQVQAAVRAAMETPHAAPTETEQRRRTAAAYRAEFGPRVDSTQLPSQPPAPTTAPGVAATAALPAGQQAQQGQQSQGGGAPAEGAGDAYPALVGSHGGLTPLLHAVREGHSETVLALLDAGADVNQVSAGDHTSPLLMAIINGHFDLAVTLVERGADPTLASDAGTTPLYAVLNTQWAPKARYPQQQAYLQQRTTYLDLMKILLDGGADPNARLKKHLWYMSYTFDLLDVDTRGATPFWRAAYATDVEAMRLLVARGADPNIPTIKPEGGRRRRGGAAADPSGLPPVPDGGPGVWPIHAASGVGYGEGYAGNAHRHVPEGWLPAVKYLVEELGADVNARDHNGYTPLHHAAARGDNELILYLVDKGADVTAVSRRGQTTADMANGPVQRIPPFLSTVALLERLGSKNNHNCQSC